MIQRRRRRPEEHEPISRHEGQQHLVSFGGLDFKLAKAAKVNDATLTVTCVTCSLTKSGLSGIKLNEFYAEHFRAHTLAPAPEPTTVDVEQLVGRVRQLVGDELALVDLVVDGLELGRKVYGQLDVAGDRRDFQREALHEGRDQLMYDCADVLSRLRRARSEAKQ